MAFILNSEGAAVFSLSGQATPQTDILDPSLLFHADFFGAKVNRYVQNIIRTNGSLYNGTATMANTDTRKRFYHNFTIYFGKTFDKPPPCIAGYVSNYEITYNTTLFPQWIVSDAYYMDRWNYDSAGNVQQRTIWGWAASIYPDRAVVSTYEMDGDFILYVMDIG